MGRSFHHFLPPVSVDEAGLVCPMEVGETIGQPPKLPPPFSLMGGIQVDAPVCSPLALLIVRQCSRSLEL